MLQSLEKLAKTAQEANSTRQDAFKSLHTQISDSMQATKKMQELKSERKLPQQIILLSTILP